MIYSFFLRPIGEYYLNEKRKIIIAPQKKFNQNFKKLLFLHFYLSKFLNDIIVNNHLKNENIQSCRFHNVRT